MGIAAAPVGLLLVVALGGCASASARFSGPAAGAQRPGPASQVASGPASGPAPGPAPGLEPAPAPATAFAPALPAPDTRVDDPALVETSGLTASPAGPGLFWAINDGGNPARLHALDANGKALGSVEVGAANRDWEALESGLLDGVATLIIGETGDNGRRHGDVALLLVAEPDLATAPATPVTSEPLAVRRVTFVYEDGPRDVEAMGLDGDTLWLLDKPPLTSTGARRASGVYRLDLGNTAAGTPLARRVGEFQAPAGGVLARLAAALAGVDLGYPTGMALDARRGHAWVLTYLDVLRYDRVADESWALTLARAPVRRIAHGLAQAEAMALDASGAVVITSEGDEPPLVAIMADRGGRR